MSLSNKRLQYLFENNVVRLDINGSSCFCHQLSGKYQGIFFTDRFTVAIVMHCILSHLTSTSPLVLSYCQIVHI